MIRSSATLTWHDLHGPILPALRRYVTAPRAPEQSRCARQDLRPGKEKNDIENPAPRGGEMDDDVLDF